MLLQRSTGPFPDTSQIGAAAELVASLDHGDWMPVFEADISPFKINEEILRLRTRYCTRVAVRQMLGWRGFVNSIVA